MRDSIDWREALVEADGDGAVVASMLAPASHDQVAEQEGALERLLIKAARAGNPLTESQLARLRVATRDRANAGGDEPAWRGEVEASSDMLTRAA
jgi:hypothetical protein